MSTRHAKVGFWQRWISSAHGVSVPVTTRFCKPEDLFPRYEIVASGCWEWRRSINNRGYGALVTQRVRWLAHRLSYFLATGDTPEMVLHNCDNRLCVNPKHLRAGTAQDNTDDMWDKGRAKPTKKFPDEVVRQVLADYASGQYQQKDLVQKYGASKAWVSQVCNRLQRTEAS